MKRELKFRKKIAAPADAVQEVQPDATEELAPVRSLIFRAKSRPERRSFSNPFKNDSGWKWGLTPKELTKRLAKWHQKAEEHLILIDDSMMDDRTTSEQRQALQEIRKYFVAIFELTPAAKKPKPSNKVVN